MVDPAPAKPPTAAPPHTNGDGPSASSTTLPSSTKNVKKLVPPTGEIVLPNAGVGSSFSTGQTSLSKMEWASMENALEPHTKATHLSLQKWLFDRARSLGIKNKADPDSDEDDSDFDDESDADADGTPSVAATASTKPSTKDGGAKKGGKVEVQDESVDEKNWSSVRLAHEEAKLAFKGVFSG